MTLVSATMKKESIQHLLCRLTRRSESEKLWYVSSESRKYRESIIKFGGMKHVLHALNKSQNEVMINLLHAVLNLTYKNRRASSYILKDKDTMNLLRYLMIFGNRVEIDTSIWILCHIVNSSSKNAMVISQCEITVNTITLVLEETQNAMLADVLWKLCLSEDRFQFILRHDSSIVSRLVQVVQVAQISTHEMVYSIFGTLSAIAQHNKECLFKCGKEILDVIEKNERMDISENLQITLLGF